MQQELRCDVDAAPGGESDARHDKDREQKLGEIRRECQTRRECVAQNHDDCEQAQQAKPGSQQQEIAAEFDCAVHRSGNGQHAWSPGHSVSPDSVQNVVGPAA